MHLILTGATGMVGAEALRYCLASPTITQLSILSRRKFDLPVGDNLNVTKAQVFVHEDYNVYPPQLVDSLKGAEGCIWAQGISQNEVGKEDYIRITYDYPLAAAKAFASLSNTGKFNFVYVSGEGADVNEKTWTLFGKIKGRTEADLVKLSSTPEYSSLRIFNVRPAMVDPPVHRRPRSFAMRASTALIAPIIRNFVPSMHTPTGVLSKVLVDLAAGDGNALPYGKGTGVEAEGRTVRSAGIWKLSGEL